MQALRLTGIERLELAEVPAPVPAADEVLIRTAATTICTSDLTDLRENPFHLAFPACVGHEGAGIVAAVGAAVRGCRVGDRVAAHPVHPCRVCPTCRAGKGHLCDQLRHFGLNMPGTFGEFFVAREDRVRRLPTAVDFAAGALAEPVCVCLEALAQARLRPGQRLLVLGDGPFGLIMARLATRLGLARLVIAGRHDYRLAYARGAVPVNTRAADDPTAVLRAAADASGYDAVLLAAGNAAAVAQGLSLLVPQGRLVVFATITEPTPVDLFTLMFKELEIVGACNDQDRFDDAIAALADPALALGDLVTHRFPFTRYADAFALAATGHAQALKVALTFE